MKLNSVVLAFDDSPHLASQTINGQIREGIAKDEITYHKTELFGITCRGTQLIHVAKNEITIDGMDSTEAILAQFDINPHKKEIRLILVDSPTLGGFNAPNPFKIFEITGIPLILLPDSKPKYKIVDLYRTIFPDRHEIINYLTKLPPLENLSLHPRENPSISGDIYFHCIGIESHSLKTVFSHLALHSSRPEPLRLAHLIASHQKV